MLYVYTVHTSRRRVPTTLQSNDSASSVPFPYLSNWSRLHSCFSSSIDLKADDDDVVRAITHSSVRKCEKAKGGTNVIWGAAEWAAQFPRKKKRSRVSQLDRADDIDIFSRNCYVWEITSLFSPRAKVTFTAPKKCKKLVLKAW